MAQEIITLLDELLKNGTDSDTKVLGAAMKAMLGIQMGCKEDLAKIKTHMEDKSLHTPKGLLVRNDVLKWMVGLTILISAIVQYVPDFIKWIVGLF